jgi:hypothetical protein
MNANTLARIVYYAEIGATLKQDAPKDFRKSLDELQRINDKHEKLKQRINMCYGDLPHIMHYIDTDIAHLYPSLSQFSKQEMQELFKVVCFSALQTEDEEFYVICEKLIGRIMKLMEGSR